MAGVTPEVMAERIRFYQIDLSYSGMSTACAAGLRPARRKSKKKNVGFTDRTGKARKNIGKVRKYKSSYARQRGGGGAYFSGGSIISVFLEYDFHGRYQFLRPAVASSQSEMLEAFTRTAEREIDKAERKAVARTGGRL